MATSDPFHLAWFVGDQAGAHARFQAVAPHLVTARTTLVTEGPATPPLAGIDRLALPWNGRARLQTWLEEERPDLVVLDGGPDPALTTTFQDAGIDTVTVRRPGDPVVLSAREGPATAWLAPYPAALDGTGARSELSCAPGWLSRFAGRRPNRRAGRLALGLPVDAPVVTVLCGRDGLGALTDVASAAAATPAWRWVTVGRCGATAPDLPANLVRLGWRDDPWPALEAADVVVASAATSVVAEVASADRPLLVVPRPGRPDDLEHAAMLARTGAARTVRTWPHPHDWSRVLASAARPGSARPSFVDDGRGGIRAAAWLLTIAARPGGRVPTTAVGGGLRA